MTIHVLVQLHPEIVRSSSRCYASGVIRGSSGSSPGLIRGSSGDNPMVIQGSSGLKKKSRFWHDGRS
eukprot:3486852-Karenia_brevis.AAC.1